MSSTASFFANTQSTDVLFLVLFTVACVSLTACGDDPVSSDEDEGDPTEEMTLQGELENYDLGENNLTASNGFDLAEGSLNSDGTFEVTLFGKDAIEDELETIDPDGSALDGFPGFICLDAAYDEVGSDVQFASTVALTFLHDGTSAIVSPTSGKPDIVQPVPNADAIHVRWIFAEQAVSIDAECRDGERSVDLNLEAGWNEVIYDNRDRGNIQQYTGDRPGSVEWKFDL